MVLSNMSLEELVREAEHTENELALRIAKQAYDEGFWKGHMDGWESCEENEYYSQGDSE